VRRKTLTESTQFRHLSFTALYVVTTVAVLVVIVNLQ